MKPNKLSEGYNLLWEGSRMMLPEHKEAILKQNDALCKRVKPTIGEDQLEEIIRTLGLVIFNELEARITIWSEFEDISLIGKVTKVDRQTKRLKVECEEESHWIRFNEIIDIQI